MQISEFGVLTSGEEALLAGLASGDFVDIGGDDLPPPDAGPERQVRAALLRALLLGRLEGLAERGARLHEKGLQIAGARITGTLDLEGARLPGDFWALACRFDAAPVLRSAMAENIALSGSVLPGLEADRLETRGTVFLGGVTAEGEVRLPRALLGGDFDCEGARFTGGKDGRALMADGLETRGTVFLRDVTAEGEVRLAGAKLGGDFDCEGARFTGGEGGDALLADGLETRGKVVLDGVTAKGAVRLVGAKLGGDLDCEGARFTGGEGGRALTLQAARIEGVFFLRVGARVAGVLDLTAAEIGAIADDPACWPGPGNLLLDRCRYGAFVGRAPVDAAARIRWLDLQDAARGGQDFWPQPWEQAAQVLREAGHRAAARAILIAKEQRQRRAARARIAALPGQRLLWEGLGAGLAVFAVVTALWGWEPGLALAALTVPLFGINLHRVARDGLLGATIRYGHVPLLAFAWLFLFWFVGFFVFAGAEARGAIKPNQPVVLRSPEWVRCAGSDPAARLACFLARPEAGSYPAFSPAIYSADVLLPIVSLEMQGFWIPDDRVPGYGAFARAYLWAQIALGWGLSLLAVAGFSGLVRTDR